MGIAAVPGSGKTWTLSLLAVELIMNGLVSDDQEILVVTLVNSAVNNFYSKISEFIEDKHLIPHIGYRVRTLHGLAHDIVRGRPDLAGLTDDFIIIDERETSRIISDIVNSWMQSHSSIFMKWIQEDIDGSYLYNVKRNHLPKLLESICANSIRYAKDHLLNPEMMRDKLDNYPINMELAEVISEMYSEYQKRLNYLGGIDFDDLVRFALISLQSDLHYLQRLQDRWPYILEDEAQDSSYLQEQVLTLLAGSRGNWVRVGDPNQAIFETFTTADPKFLLNFIKRPDVISQELLESGRSSLKIIGLANYLVEWTNNEHPIKAVRDALSSQPLISPTKKGDVQKNPDLGQSQVFIGVENKYSPKDEISRVVDSLLRWLPENPDSTVAVLVPRNERGNEIVDEVKRNKLPYNDSLLRSTKTTRNIAELFGKLLEYLVDTKSIKKIDDLYQAYRNYFLDPDAADDSTMENETAFSPRNKPEVLFSQEGRKLLIADMYAKGCQDAEIQRIEIFFIQVKKWLELAMLPADQIIISVSQDLFKDPPDLALSYKLATFLRHLRNNNPDTSLVDCANELKIIAKNERRFLGYGDDDQGFNPDSHKGKVVVSTIHKAKGLEWDRVYLMSINDYNFPSGTESDKYVFEKWFIKGKKNLEAETLKQIDILIDNNLRKEYLDEDPTYSARLDFIRERLRLLYVGITRARKDLIITWNTGRMGNSKPATALVSLRKYQQSMKWVEDFN